MPKVLIVSYLYAPTFAIGAVRWTKLAKYLSLGGCEVDVLTTSAKSPEDKLLAADIQYVSHVYRIDHKNHRYDQTTYYRDAQTVEAIKQNGGKRTLIRRMKDLFWRSRLFELPGKLYSAHENYGRSKDFAAQAERFIKNELDMAQYDAVICTYGPTCGTLLALWLRKNYPQLPLIMDFRDPMTNNVNPRLYDRIYNRQQKKICAAADRIVTVTDGIEERICAGKYREKTCTISNGYDPVDLEGAEPFPESRYSIVYTGGMYTGRADFTPLFRALSELIESGAVDRSSVVFHHIGAEGDKMAAQARKFGVDDILESHGRLERTSSLSWQRSARLLTMFVWNYKNETGILSGKFLEYITAGVPILPIISGDAGGSILRRSVEEHGFGVGYESVTADEDYQRIKDFIAGDYRRWKQGLAPDFCPDADFISSYSYPVLARQVAELIDGLCAEQR